MKINKKDIPYLPLNKLLKIDLCCSCSKPNKNNYCSYLAKFQKKMEEETIKFLEKRLRSESDIKVGGFTLTSDSIKSKIFLCKYYKN